MLLTALALVASIIFFTALTTFLDLLASGPHTVEYPLNVSGSVPGPGQVPSPVSVLLVLLGLASFVLSFVIATGIYSSRRWAFQSAIVIFAPFCLVGGGPMGFAILITVYSVLRLNAKLGPAPT